MSLPADVARCGGASIYTDCVQMYYPSLHPECQTCRRTEPVPQGAGRSVHMAPPVFVDGKCPEKIGE